MIHPYLSKNPFLLLQHLPDNCQHHSQTVICSTHQSDSLARSGQVAGVVEVDLAVSSVPLQSHPYPFPSCCLLGVRVSADLYQLDSWQILQARWTRQWGYQLRIGIQAWKTALCPRMRQSMRIAAWRELWTVRSGPAETTA